MYKTVVAMLSIITSEKIISSSKGRANPDYLTALDEVKCALLKLRRFC